MVIDPTYMTLAVTAVSLLVIVFAFSSGQSLPVVAPGGPPQIASTLFGLALLAGLVWLVWRHRDALLVVVSPTTPPVRGTDPAPAASKSGKKGWLQGRNHQVFHIPGNEYTYEDAKAVCHAYGAELATYDQLEDAYARGAEWCTYGWSQDQLALFPTQKSTYVELQKHPGREHSCGRPGINGGYVPSATSKYGINCYGRRPRMGAREQEYMEDVMHLPQTEEERKFQERVQYWKSRLHNLVIAPFNRTTYSR